MFLDRRSSHPHPPPGDLVEETLADQATYRHNSRGSYLPSSTSSSLSSPSTMAAGPSGPPHNLHNSSFPRSPTRSYDSSSVSSNTSPKPLPLPPAGQAGATSRAEGGGERARYLGLTPGARPPPPIGIHPFTPASQTLGSGFQPYTPVTATMGRDSALPPGPSPHHNHHQHHPQPPHPHPNPGSPAPSLGQQQQQQGKRAYRQRRKDPSCDACRERKVKCDATESTSCSECSSRNVKCQFTKDTNKRMSSMKHVQDLMNRMTDEAAELKKVNSALRDQLRGGVDVGVGVGVEGRSFHAATGVETKAATKTPAAAAAAVAVPEQMLPPPLPQLPELNSQPKRRKRPAPLAGLDGVREFARKYARGVWKAPEQCRIPTGHQNYSSTTTTTATTTAAAAPAAATTATTTTYGNPGTSLPPLLGPPPPARPQLPPRAHVDQLLHQYYNSVHIMFPVVHWPSFHRSVDEIYHGNCQHTEPARLSVFFAVLAVAGLFSTHPGQFRFRQPAETLEMVRWLTDPWNNEMVLDNVRAMALTALALGEMNLKSAAWVALGRAVRAAQDIGLHVEPAAAAAATASGAAAAAAAPSSSKAQARARRKQESSAGRLPGPGTESEQGWMGVEAEMRRRVWWSLYVLDRSFAAELGRPVMIDDADCDVALPLPVDDHYFGDQFAQVTPDTVKSSLTLFSPMINTSRAYGPLLRALSSCSSFSSFYPSSHAASSSSSSSSTSTSSSSSSSSSSTSASSSSPSSSPSSSSPSTSAPSPGLSPTRLSTFDQHLSACAELFPPECDPASTAPLVPQVLSPLAMVLGARLLLHRHNLGPGSTPEARRTAVQQCTLVASETSQILQRLSSPVADVASAALTMHVFRCCIFSLWAGRFEAALSSLGALAGIGDRRDVAVPCGRFLAHFVSLLSHKRAEYAARLSSYSSTPQGPPHHGHESTRLQAELSRDEELIALASADLQACVDGGWVWDAPAASSPRAGSAAAAAAATAASSSSSTSYSSFSSSPSFSSGGGGNLFSVEARTGMSAVEAQEWTTGGPGWERLEAAVRMLAGGRQAQQPNNNSLGPHSRALATSTPTPTLTPTPTPTPIPTPLPGLAAFATTTPAAVPAATSGGVLTGKDRLSIANIMS